MYVHAAARLKAKASATAQVGSTYGLHSSVSFLWRTAATLVLDLPFELEFVAQI